MRVRVKHENEVSIPALKTCLTLIPYRDRVPKESKKTRNFVARVFSLAARAQMPCLRAIRKKGAQKATHKGRSHDFGAT